MNKKLVLSILVTIMMVAICGCQTYGIVKTDDFEKKIDEVKQELSNQIDNNNKEIIKQQTELLEFKDEMGRQAAGLIYGALQANYTIMYPERVDIVQRLRLETALQKLPALDPSQLIEQRNAMIKELDEKNTTIAQLEEKYNKLKEEATKQQQELKDREQKIKETEEKRQQLEREKNLKVEELRKAQVAEKNKVINKQAEDLASKEAHERNVRILIYIFTAVGVAAGVGAYLIKSVELGGVAAISIGIAVLVAVLEPWQLACGVLAMFALIWFGYHRKYKREKITKENVIGAVQEAKKEAKDAYTQILQPKLKEWFAEDKDGEKHVEDTLKELNLK